MKPDKKNKHLRLFEITDLYVIKKYLTDQSWNDLETFKNIYEKDNWKCQVCFKYLKRNQELIRCDQCLLWHHKICLKIKYKRLKNMQYFYCKLCEKN